MRAYNKSHQEADVTDQIEVTPISERARRPQVDWLSVQPRQGPYSITSYGSTAMSRIDKLKTLLAWIDQVDSEAHLLSMPGFDRDHVDSLIELGQAADAEDLNEAIGMAREWIAAVPDAIKADVGPVPAAYLPIFNGHAESLHTIIAALRFWQSHGMCDPDNRSPEFQDLATGGDEVTSLCSEDLDELIEQLNFDSGEP